MDQALRELEQIKPTRDTVLTIGVFDGVHRGHQHLMRQVIERAKAAHRQSGVITFYPHPRVVLHPDLSQYYVTSLEDRLALIAGTGVDFVLKLTFTPAMAQMPAEDFVDLLQRHLRMRELVVGPDFALGRGRGGNIQALREIGQQRGFSVHVIQPITWDTLTVSSTGVRRAIAEGDVSQVATLLGRPFSLYGTVVMGDRRGRTLGFPTANLQVLPDVALPADGIYATVARFGDERFPSVTNVGVRPSFNLTERTVETFIFDFDRDVYGQTMRLEFVQRLRDELKFPSVDALVEQMRRDVENAKVILR